MNGKPSVIVTSCSSNTELKSLIKSFTNCTDAVLKENELGFISCDWTINTKYYIANVNVFGVTKQCKQSFNDKCNAEALIIYLDNNKENILDDLQELKDFGNDCELDVKLLVTNYCSNKTLITKNSMVSWCIKHEFELVELYPDNLLNEEAAFMEKVGVDRITEALQAHMWTNLKTKDQKKSPVELLPSDSPNDYNSSDIEDDFTDLFQHMHLMKENLKFLPLNERKQYAEHIVTAFWNAIGGDEEFSDI